jgi:hypothetical protein
MIAFIASGLQALALVVLPIVVVGAFLIFYALRNKGDVFAELSHGKTTLRIPGRNLCGHPPNRHWLEDE